MVNQRFEAERRKRDLRHEVGVDQRNRLILPV
jgi:hypothetical protein